MGRGGEIDERGMGGKRNGRKGEIDERGMGGKRDGRKEGWAEGGR
jgi:hypothetical protein